MTQALMQTRTTQDNDTTRHDNTTAWCLDTMHAWGTTTAHGSSQFAHDGPAQ